MAIINEIKEFALDLVFPEKCVFCGRLTDKTCGGICDSCARSVTPLEGGIVKTDGSFFKYCVSSYEYCGAVRESILRYKFGGHSSYARTFGRVLAQTIERYVDLPCDIITYVPVSRKRLNKRGYDQAQLLAKYAAQYLDRQCVCVLKKVKNNPAQSGIDSAERRRANVMDMYSVCGRELIKGKRILLIDDIITSGATLSECARELLMAGADSVICAALAKRV